MNGWLWAALATLFAMVPCGWACVRGDAVQRLAAVELASVIAALMIILLAEGYGRKELYDVALCIALLSFPAGLVYAHFLERWL